VPKQTKYLLQNKLCENYFKLQNILLPSTTINKPD